jgi:hypothetical protein
VCRRRKHYAIRTEQAYVSWSTRYIRFRQLRHPRQMGTAEVEAFLTKSQPGYKKGAQAKRLRSLA